jgi:hypothetical protein
MQLVTEGVEGALATTLFSLVRHVLCVRRGLIRGAGDAIFANACKPIVKQRWLQSFTEMYSDVLSSLSPLSIQETCTTPSAEAARPPAPAPPLWLSAVPLPILYITYAILVEKGISVTDEAILQVVSQPDVLFRGYQDVQISAMQEHQYGMVRGAAATAYAEMFEKMAEAGSLDHMLKVDPVAAAEADDDDDDPNREIAWWCIPPDSDLSRGKDALAALIGEADA